jgi:hypothetical protein
MYRLAGSPTVSKVGASLLTSSGSAVSQQHQGGPQFAWALFDWANSPFTTLIITFVFPAYFATAIVGDEVSGQAIWGLTWLDLNPMSFTRPRREYSLRMEYRCRGIAHEPEAHRP